MRYNRLIKKLFAFGIGIACFLAAAPSASAQGVANVDAGQEGKSIAVTYDLKEKANISLYVTQDGGRTRTAIPMQFLSGDIGKGIDPGVGKKVLWRVLDQYPNENFEGTNMSFIVVGRPAMRFFLKANAAYSLDSGIMGGFSFGQFGTVGWYGKVMTTFSVPRVIDFECDATGSINGVYPAYTGYGSRFKAYGVAGVNVRLGLPLYLNAGAGYGLKEHYWQTVEGQWIRVAPDSFNGIVLDLGLSAMFKRVVISAGASYMVNPINQYPIDFSIGAGWVF